jgi:hypothetical protein
MPRPTDVDLFVAAHSELWQSHLTVIESLVFLDDEKGPKVHMAFFRSSALCVLGLSQSRRRSDRGELDALLGAFAQCSITKTK